jgi:hypothetical protein
LNTRPHPPTPANLKAETMRCNTTAARQNIAAYLWPGRELSSHTLLCFVGMIETGEATPADFDFVQPGLAAIVTDHKTKLDKDRV